MILVKIWWKLVELCSKCSTFFCFSRRPIFHLENGVQVERQPPFVLHSFHRPRVQYMGHNTEAILILVESFSRYLTKYVFNHSLLKGSKIGKKRETCIVHRPSDWGATEILRLSLAIYEIGWHDCSKRRTKIIHSETKQIGWYYALQTSHNTGCTVLIIIIRIYHNKSVRMVHLKAHVSSPFFKILSHKNWNVSSE